ncbi:MAG: hypothetical protein ACPH09_02380 [Pseudomonadales bacterium]
MMDRFEFSDNVDALIFLVGLFVCPNQSTTLVTALSIKTLPYKALPYKALPYKALLKKALSRIALPNELFTEAGTVIFKPLCGNLMRGCKLR